MRVLSGIQPTNTLTLGNYLGAIKRWVDLQKNEASEDYEAFYTIVDLHAVTVPQNPHELRQATLEAAATYLACGLDPSRATLFVQSHVSEHSELAWLLNCMTPMGWLSRMTQFKDKAGKKRDQVGLGLFAYPTLMAADILLYGTTHVPVGEDQKQHIELTRDLALSVNHFFKEDFFVIPEPLISRQGARIMSLRDGQKKMSKSDPSDMSRINLMDSDDTIALKIRKATTDPEPLPSSIDEFENRFEAKNLLNIYATLRDISMQEALNEVKGMPFSIFKPLLTEVMITHIRPIREKTIVLLEDQVTLDRILQRGAEKAKSYAAPCLEGYKKRIGFYGS